MTNPPPPDYDEDGLISYSHKRRRYRVIVRRGHYVPQYKCLFSWHDLFRFNYYLTLEEAETALRRFACELDGPVNVVKEYRL